MLLAAHLSASMMVCSLCATASRVRSLNSLLRVSCRVWEKGQGQRTDTNI